MAFWYTRLVVELNWKQSWNFYSQVVKIVFIFWFDFLMYVPLHWHSTFSFLEALGQPKDIIKRAKELLFPAIAITDYNGMFWVPSFFLAAKDSKNPEDENDKWVKAIFGLEIWFVMDLNSSWVGKSVWNLCLLAETDEWYHNMMELIAYANQTGFTNWTQKLDLSVLKEKSGWIRIFAGWELSWISKMLSAWESEAKIKEIYDMLHEIFGEKCYLEITAQDETLLPITKKVNKFIYDLAKKTNTKLIVDNDYRYLKEKDKEAWEIALSIKDWTKMYDTNRRKPAGKYHIMDGEEIRGICIKNWYKAEEVDEWIQNNGNIAKELNASMLLNQKLFPKYKTPDYIQEYYDKYWATSIEY